MPDNQSKTLYASRECANARHQKHKAAWGAKKKRLLDLLIACRPFVDGDMIEAIDYELAHDEFLKVHYIKDRLLTADEAGEGKGSDER